MRCPTVYEGYMVWYIVGFSVSYNHFNIYGYCIFMIIFTTRCLYILCSIFMLGINSGYNFLNNNFG